MKKILLLFFSAILCVSQAYANITITAPSKTDFCLNTATGIGGNIQIQEGANNDFPIGTNYIFMTAPAGFEFVTGSGNLSKSDNDISGNPTFLFRTSTIFAISYTVNTNTNNGNIIISNIQLIATDMGSGAIQFGTGSTSLPGVGANATMANVSTSLTAINFPAVSAKCSSDGNVTLNGSVTTSAGNSSWGDTYTSSPVALAAFGTNFSPTIAGAGSHTVTYTVNANGGCTYSKSITIDVNSAPNVSMSVQETSGTTNNDGKICAGASVTFTGYGANSYKFYKGAGQVSTSSTYTSTSLANGDVIYVEGTANGCKDNSSNVTMTVNPTPANPQFSPSNSSYSSSAPGFWLDSVGTASEEAGRSVGDPSYFTGNGVVFQSGRYFFYPNVAGSGTHTIVYHYVNPTTRCESTTSKSFTVAGVTAAGSISNLNSQYCIYDAPVTINVDFCDNCSIGCQYFYYMQYSTDGGVSWYTMPYVSASTISSTCGPYGYDYETRYNFTLDPASLGVGIKLFRYYYYSYNSGGYIYSTPQTTTINGYPTVAITNAFSAVTCSNTTYSLLTYSANGASGVGVFSSTTTGFVKDSTASDYYVYWNKGASSDVAQNNTISLTFTDNVTGCATTTSRIVYVANKPAPPTIYSGYPFNFCLGDYTYGYGNGSSGYTYQWIKDLPSNTPTYTDNFYPDYGYTYFPRGSISADEKYYIKTYRYAGCVSDASAEYNLVVKTPAKINVGQYNTVCSNQQINLNKLQKTGSPVTQTWSTFPTNNPGGFDNVNANSPIYTLSATDIANKTVTFRVTTSDPDGPNGCPYIIKDTIVTINELPVVTATSSMPVYCSDNLVTLYASSSNLSALPITWYKGPVLGADQTGISSPNNVTTGFSLTPAEKSGGNITFNVVSTDPDGPSGPCTNATAAVTIQINPEAVVDAGLDVYSCGSSNISLSGSTIKIGGTNNLDGYWTHGAWSTTYLGTNNPKNATYTPTAAEATNGGSYVFTLVSMDPDGAGPCSYKTDTRIVTINKEAFITADADYTACSDSVLTLNCVPSGVSTLTVSWYKNAFGGPQTGLTNPNNVSTNYNLSPAEKSGGPITFWVQTSDPDGAGPTGPCPAVNEQIVVNINPEAVVDPGVTIYTCGAAVVPLSGTCTTFGAGNLGATWSKGAWSSTVPAATNPKTASYTPTVGEASAGGAYTYALTSDDPDGAGPCKVVTKYVTNVINRAPFVDAGTDATYCSNTTPVLTAALTGSATGVTWTKSAGSGTIGNPNNISTSYAVHPGDYASGLNLTIDFTATTNDPDGTGPTGPCTAASDIVTITLSPHLTVNAGSDITVCANQTINLNGNVKIGGTNRMDIGVNTWKTFDGTGTFTPVGPSNFTGTYNPSGTLTSSGTSVVVGTGELGLGKTLYAYLVSADPDGAGPTGPCKADSQAIKIVINPLPVTHFVAATKREYCTNDNSAILEGNLGSTFSSTGASASFSGGSYVSPTGSNFEFDPKKTRLIDVSGGTYGLTYTFKDNNGCTNFEDISVNVYPFPVVSFTSSSRCQYDLITFTETSTVSSAKFASNVTHTETDWLIDGMPTVNSQTAQATFANYGIHTFHLDVTSLSTGATINCFSSKDTSLIFAPYPNTKFAWSRPCSVDSVAFVNQTTIPAGYSNSIHWTMGGTGIFTRRLHPATTTADSLNPVYKYVAPGVYNVMLRAVTYDNTGTILYGCTKDTTVQVYVVPTIAVTASTPYATSFGSSNMNWAPSGQNYSWDYGTPSGKQVINPGKNVWVTNLSGNYNLKEYSALNSPCFNFQNLDKPMMTQNLWANTRNLAGAVLEATTGNNNSWVTIGQIGDGKNWYNTQGIVGLIGKSSTNPIAQGFSGESTTGFDLSRIGLSQYASQSALVRFRITFGSSDVDDDLNKRDGIAFDSIWLGNRSKVVLAEHFTNSMNNLCIEANDTINAIQNRKPGDMVSIHYHTSFPGLDNMNRQNVVDPSSRVLYYGLTETPRTVIDGKEQYKEYGNTAAALKVNYIDNKALENAKFSLDLTSKKVGMNLEVKAQLVAKEILAQDVVLNFAVVEETVLGAIVGGNQSAYKWVLKKMLPDAAGTYISKTWAIGDTMKVAQTWNFNLSDFYDTSKVRVVAFVQNFSTKEVYQAAKTGSNGTTGSPVITEVEVQDIEENLLVYPVPADYEINVLFGKELIYDTEYTLNDDLGRAVEKGKIEKGERMISFNSKKLAAGMYYLSLTKQDGSKFNRKIVVIH